jgi:predicted transposase YbfD/YdcC
MDAQATGGFLRFFGELPDPRAANAVHRLDDILVIAVCAVLCGADTWVDVETFGNAKLPWLSTFLALPRGIPSHDTFGRVFAALDPDAFERCFEKWMAALRRPGTRLVAIDGKSIRRSFEHAWDASGMAHLVSAFAAENENRLTFAQVAAAAPGQELAAMRRLLDLLALDETAVVTIDALGCQRDVAQQIVAGRADYVLAVKENQPTLHAAVKRVLDEALLEKFRGLRHGRSESTCGGHGRIETRRVWVSDQAVEHLGEVAYEWPALASVAVVESTRQVVGSGKRPSTQRRYYISSIAQPDAKRMGEAIRGHWGIENGLHWQLDVSFGEDQRRVRKDHGAENFSRLCRIALNLLKVERTAKVGVKGKRLKAGWDEPYLLRLLTG